MMRLTPQGLVAALCKALVIRYSAPAECLADVINTTKRKMEVKWFDSAIAN
jgi:hypothetical protein